MSGTVVESGEAEEIDRSSTLPCEITDLTWIRSHIVHAKAVLHVRIYSICVRSGTRVLAAWRYGSTEKPGRDTMQHFRARGIGCLVSQKAIVHDREENCHRFWTGIERHPPSLHKSTEHSPCPPSPDLCFTSRCRRGYPSGCRRFRMTW